MSTTTFELVDPNDLLLEENVRTTVDLDEGFVRSIKENGVLTAVLAHRNTEGKLVVRAGQRRTLAARKAGITTVPVQVVDGDEQTATRIIEQLVENDQRADLTGLERVEAFKQLEFEGISLREISKRSGSHPTEVKAALAVAKSGAALTAIAQHTQLTLEQAAVLTEFEDDEDRLSDLIDTALHHPDEWEHDLQRHRDSKAAGTQRAKLAAEYEARGYKVWEDNSVYSEAREWMRLVGPNGPVTAEELETLDGRGVYIPAWGEPRVELHISRPLPDGYDFPAGAARADTPEQIAEREERDQRRQSWDSAETVRRAWLTEFLQRKHTLTSVAPFIALTLTRYVGLAGYSMQYNDVTYSLMGQERHADSALDPLALQVDLNPSKALTVTLAVAVGIREKSLSFMATEAARPATATFLQQLQKWGYTLSAIEQVAVDLATTDPEPDAA
jgi:ParB family transcriptional regulator, chromosome partitioning protein